MVRAGVVRHPSEWRWCGYDELVGKRARYRLLDYDRLLESLGVYSLMDLRCLQKQGVEDAIQKRELERQADWTEALAVGDQQFVGRVSGLYDMRRKFTYTESGIHADIPAWTIHEASVPYNSLSGAK
jgi:putative transposase